MTNVKQRQLVLCSGVQIPDNDPLRDGRQVIEPDALSPNSNTHLRIENVTDAFARNLPDRLVDLLEIATYVYTADCAANRELAWVDEKSTEPWSRDFVFVLPVRDIQFWTRTDVTATLVDALNHLSSDHFKFEFRPLPADRSSESYLQIGDEDLLAFKGAERVIMFSGGLDSLAGAVETAARGEPLLLVSHRSAPQMNKRQKELFNKLRATFAVPMMHVPVWVNKSGYDGESTQRTRSFLFSAIGSTVASVLGVGGVRFYENGIISLNWPLAGEVLQSRASRTTHPEAIRRLQSLYRLILDNNQFVIDNPFIFKTKTEVVQVIADSGASNLIGESRSCAHTMFQSKTQLHCGCCGQCIDRRIAILADGLDEYDSGLDYAVEVFTGARILNDRRPYDHNIAVNYARFATDIHRMSEEEIGATYNLELSRTARCFPNASEAAQAFIDMHKRHASSVMSTLEQQMSLHLRELVEGSIEKTSLLGMVGRREHVETYEPAVAVDTNHSREESNTFRQTGDYWTVTFCRKTIQLRNGKGLFYIAWLLANPNREFYALQIVHEVEKTPYEPDAVYMAMGNNELDEYGLTVSDFTDNGPVMDQAYEKECRDGLKKAEANLARAQSHNDAAGMKRESGHIKHYQRALNEGIGISGRHRNTGGAIERARVTLSQAIGRVMNTLKKQHPPLYDHLRSSIQTGIKCSYSPTVPVDWDL